MLSASRRTIAASAATAALVLFFTSAAASAEEVAGAGQHAAPIKIAVFDFELQDFSAAGTTVPKPLEAKYLAEATNETRRLLTQSGRYTLVDTTGADLSAAHGHGLSTCDGCDAAIAAGLGADQDLVGVVTKISMTEYTVTAQLRDAHSGAVLKTATTGLRMGAGYSWARGANSLVAKQLLAARE
jgi:hypothetical protein